MKIIAVLKGDLKDYKKVDIGIVVNYGILKPAGKDMLTVVSTNLILQQPSGVEEFKEPESVEEALITVDYDLVRGIDASTLKVWSADAKEAARGHIKNRNNRYMQMAKTFAAVQDWNKTYKGDNAMLVDVDTIGSRLMEQGTGLAEYIKNNNVKPKQMSFSVMLKSKPTNELIL